MIPHARKYARALTHVPRSHKHVRFNGENTTLTCMTQTGMFVTIVIIRCDYASPLQSHSNCRQCRHCCHYHRCRNHQFRHKDTAKSEVLSIHLLSRMHQDTYAVPLRAGSTMHDDMQSLCSRYVATQSQCSRILLPVLVLIHEIFEIPKNGLLGLDVSGQRRKFKNCLGDVSCTWISLNPRPATQVGAVWALWGGGLRSAGIFTASTPTIPARCGQSQK